MWTKNLVLNCFLLLSFIALIQWTGADEEDDFACFVFQSKPDPRSVLPKKTGMVPGKTKMYDLARHHIIPFDFLRKFFNFAAIVNVDANLRTAIDREIRHLLDSYVDSPGLISPELRDKIRAPTERETVVKAVKFFYSWLPGNIFYGPPSNLRSDDPHGGFEVDSYEIIGDNNYKTLGNLYIKMVNFVESAKYRNADIFREIVSDLVTLFNRRTPFEYNKDKWEVDPKMKNKVRIRLPGREVLPKIPKQPTPPAPTDCFAPHLLETVKEPIVKKIQH